MKYRILNAGLRILIPVFLLGMPLAAAAEVYPTTVAGFQNTRDENDETQMVITRSLTQQLSVQSDARVTAFDQVEKYRSDQKLGKKISEELALAMAYYFNSKRVVFGTYTLKAGGRRISIRVKTLNTVSGETILDRNFEGPAGIALFDTVENVSRAVSLLLVGLDRQMGAYRLTVTGKEGQYRIMVNAREAGLIMTNRSFSMVYPVREPFELSLEKLPERTEVLRKRINLENTNTLDDVYWPRGSILVKNEGVDVILTLNRNQQVLVGQGQEILFPDLSVAVPHQLEFSVGNRVVEKKSVWVKEGTVSISVIKTMGISVPAGYAGSTPWMSAVLPGFAQYQAGEWWWGGFYSLLGAAAVTSTALCTIYAVQVNAVMQQPEFQNDSYVQTVSGPRLLGQLTAGAIGSAAVWATVAVAGWLHADLARQGSVRPVVGAGPDGSGLMMAVSVRF